MIFGKQYLRAALACAALAAALPAQPQLKPQTLSDFDCYAHSAEARMAARKTFLLAEGDSAMKDQLVRGRKIVANAVEGSNPRKVSGGLLFDWIGTVFLPGASAERTVRMMQDYDHRTEYFSEVVAASKLLCRTGEGQFGYSMRLKEPSVIDSDNDVVWEKVDAKHWRCRSYSTKVREVEKQKGYLLRLYMYWRVAEADNGTYVEGEAIELSGEFGSMTRALGSLFLGISPEKSLRRSLNSMREALAKPGAQFALPPAGLPACGEPYRPAACTATTQR
jgi:hypothetical protein